jgi:hypothetical protein
MPAEVRPYVGPRPFEESDRQLFFGRGDEAQHVVSMIVAHPVVLLHARSGAGKSSLVNADVIPRLRHLAIESAEEHTDADEGSGAEIIGPLRVSGQVPKGADAGMNVFAYNALLDLRGANDGVRSISEHLAALPAHSSESAALRVLIFDQFEELFTHFEDRWRDRAAFFDDIGNALDGDRRLRVLFVMREEFLAGIDAYATWLPERARTRFRLEPLKHDAAMLAVKGPLAKTGRRFAPEAAEKLVSQLLQLPASRGVRDIEGEFIEPLHLQVVCQNIWESLPVDAEVITEDLIKSRGNVEEALARHYERSLGKAIAAGAREGELRRWFERTLITPNETRGLVFRDRQATGGLDNRYIDILEHAYLLRNELRGGMPWYELSHDRFVGPILRSNQQWRKRLEHGETTRERYESRAADWINSGRPASLLLTAPEFTEIAEWQKTPAAAELGVSPALSELIQRSETVAARAGELASVAEAKRLKGQRAAIIAMTVVVLIAAGVALWAAMSRAETRTRVAQLTAREAQFRAAIAGAEAEKKAKATQADDDLRMAVQNAAMRAKSSTMRETLGSTSGNLATREQEFLALALGIRAVADPSGATDPVAADALRRALRAFSDSRWLSAPEKQIQRNDLTADGRYAMILTREELLVYDLAQSAVSPKRIKPPEGRYFDVAFIEAGRRILGRSLSLSDSDNGSRFSYYDLATGVERTPLTTRVRGAKYVDTDPSGRYIDMMNDRRFVRIDTQSEKEPETSDVLVSESAVYRTNYHVGFSPDGKFALIVRDSHHAPETKDATESEEPTETSSTVVVPLHTADFEPASGAVAANAAEEEETLESLADALAAENVDDEPRQLTNAVLVDRRSMTSRPFPFDEEQSASYEVQFSPDSQSVVIYRKEEHTVTASFCRVDDGSRIAPDIPFASSSSTVYDGREFAVFTDADVTVWNVAENREVRHYALPPGNNIVTKNTGIVLLKRDNKPYQSVFSWNAFTGRMVGRIDGLKTVHDADVDETGAVFLVTRIDGMSRVWDTRRCQAAVRGVRACNATLSESTFTDLTERPLVDLACRELRTWAPDLYDEVKDRCSAVAGTAGVKMASH